MAVDLEQDGVEVLHVKGYPSLAAFISSDHDHSAVLYKRFDRLSARNILYLQSELAELERQQDELDWQDLREGDRGTRQTARDWRAFKEAAKKPGSKAAKRMTLVVEIRDKMKEYRKLQRAPVRKTHS